MFFLESAKPFDVFERHFHGLCVKAIEIQSLPTLNLADQACNVRVALPKLYLPLFSQVDELTDLP